MNYIVLLVLMLTGTASAFASGACKDGSPDAFTFVRWEVKVRDNQSTEINMTFHNNLDQTLSDASFGAVVDDKGGPRLGMQIQETAKASSDHTEIYIMQGIPANVVATLKDIKPLLCAYDLIEEKTHKHTNYLQ